MEAGKLDAELLERYYARLQRFRLLAQRLKLRSTRLHSLRQYSATELIAAGVDVAQLERQNRKEHAERRHDQKVTEVRQRNVESSALLSRDHLLTEGTRVVGAELDHGCKTLLPVAASAMCHPEP